MAPLLCSSSQAGHFSHTTSRLRSLLPRYNSSRALRFLHTTSRFHWTPDLYSPIKSDCLCKNTSSQNVHYTAAHPSMVLPAAYPSEVRQTLYILHPPDPFFPVPLYPPASLLTHLESHLSDLLFSLHFPDFLTLLLSHLSAHFPEPLALPPMYPAAHFPEAPVLPPHPSEILIFLLILLFARFLKLLIFPLRSLFVHLPDFQMYLLLLVPPHPSFLHQSLSLPVQHDPLNHHLYVYDLLPGPLLKNSGIILMLPATTPLIFSSCAFPSLSSGLIVKHI